MPPYPLPHGSRLPPASQGGARWSAAAIQQPAELHELGRYTLSEGARVLVGRRIEGEVFVYDYPRDGQGRRYFVESGFHSKVELAVLLAHYRRHAEKLGVCPMSGEAVDRALELTRGADPGPGWHALTGVRGPRHRPRDGRGGLTLIADTFPRPGHEELTEFFTGELVDVEAAERMARALELYWDGHPDESAHILVPRIEQVIRGLARRLGVPVYREPIGNEPGGVETLGTLLRAIGPAFANAGLHAYFVVLLVDPLGLNLRNKIAHGLVGRVQKPATALLLQVACVLSSFQLGTPAEEASPPPGAETVDEADSSDQPEVPATE